MNKFVWMAATLLLVGSVGGVSADTNVYGQVDVSVDVIDRDGGSDDASLGSNTSAFGIKGQEDLGSGASAIFKIEFGVMVDEGGAPTGRDQYVGLNISRFGKVRIGTLSSAYKSDASRLDPNYRTRVQARNVGIQSLLHKGKGEEGQGRMTNSIRYDTPNMAGFSATAHYTFDSTKGDGEDDDPWGAGLRYKGESLYAFADFITNNQSGDAEAWQFGLKYAFVPEFNVWAMYELDRGLISTQTWMTANNGDGADVMTWGTSYEIFGVLLALNYAQSDDSENAVGGVDVKTHYTTWSLSAQYDFSNRSKVYVGFSEQDCPKGNAVVGVKFCTLPGEDDILTMGMRHAF